MKNHHSTDYGTVHSNYCTFVSLLSSSVNNYYSDRIKLV